MPLSTVLRIPHASPTIPPECRQAFVLSDSALDDQTLRLTDHFTDELFYLPDQCVQRIVYPVSRKCGINRVARIMRSANIRSRIKGKFKATTDSRHNFPEAPNLLNQRAIDFIKFVPNVIYIIVTRLHKSLINHAMAYDLQRLYFKDEDLRWHL